MKATPRGQPALKIAILLCQCQWFKFQCLISSFSHIVPAPLIVSIFPCQIRTPNAASGATFLMDDPGGRLAQSRWGCAGCFHARSPITGLLLQGWRVPAGLPSCQAPTWTGGSPPASGQPAGPALFLSSPKPTGWTLRPSCTTSWPDALWRSVLLLQDN